MNTIIKCTNISKSFKSKKLINEVLHEINLEVEEGEFIVIAGQNGSGKSTLLKTMVGLLIPDQGHVSIMDCNMTKHWKKVSNKIGVVLSGERNLYWKLTGLENLKIFGGLYGVPTKVVNQRALNLLETVSLLEHQDMLVENYSTGMRRKLMLCKALIHEPQIIFADELLNGLDPNATREIIKILSDLNKKNITVVIVSHILHDLPEEARLLIMKEGQIAFDGCLNTLEFNSQIKVLASTEAGQIEKRIGAEQLSETVMDLIQTGITDIKIEKNDIYDLTRGYIS